MRVTAGLFYTVTDAARNIRENLATAVLSSFTVGFSLAIFAVFLIAFMNLNAVVETWGDRTHIVAYMKDGTGQKETGKLRAELEGMPGVKSFEYVSRDDALGALREELKGHEGILEGVDLDLLPASFEIRLEESHRTPQGVKETVGKLKGLPSVGDVQYGTEWAEKFTAFLRFIELGALLVGGFLAAATLFIISNTIRLTVYARKDEIEVLRLVGATDGFIKIPFLIEGLVQGFFGGVLATGMVFAGRYVLTANMPPYFDFVLETPFSIPVLFAILVLSGVFMGAVGSLVCLGRFLRA
ncbi:MAG: permease-like cell division protein FtsX [Thermodesulfobacteriota bacterium]